MKAHRTLFVILVYCSVGLIFSSVGVKLSYGAGAAFFATGIGVALATAGSVSHLVSMKYFPDNALSHFARFVLILGVIFGVFWFLFRLGIFDFA